MGKAIEGSAKAGTAKPEREIRSNGGTKFVPVKLDGINEGQFLTDVDECIHEAIRGLIELKRKYGADRMKKVKAVVNAKISIAFEGRDETDYSIRGDVKTTLPSRPACVSVAIEGDEQDETPTLFQRKSGTTKADPRQGVLATQDGRTVDPETGEILK